MSAPMHIQLIAVGRCRDKAIQSLCAEYLKRLKAYYPTTVVEVAAAGEDTVTEAGNLLAKIPSDAKVVALDERGKSLTTRDFAGQLQRWLDDGTRTVVLLIGGAAGLTDAVRARADLILSLSALTLPHMLVRPVVLEQIYRAATVNSGHPYHRD